MKCGKQRAVLRSNEGFASSGETGLFVYNRKAGELLLAGKLLNQEGPLSVLLKKVKL